MRTNILILVTFGLLTATSARAQEQPVGGSTWVPLVEGVLVSQLPGDKKAQPPDKLPIPEKKLDAPPQIVAEPTPTPSPLDLAERRVARAPEMLGDLSPPGRFTTITTTTVVPGPPRLDNQGVLVPGPPITITAITPLGILPGTGGMKVADNGSPRPQDRVYFGFNFYDNLYDPQNRALGTDIRDVRLYRETFGFEKTFFDRRVSFGMRLPVNSISVQSMAPGIGGTHTAVGDLTFILQGALLRDEEADNYLSLGMAITPPTGPDTIGNIGVNGAPHTTVLQPYAAYLFNGGNFYVQGFTAFDIGTGSSDIALWLQDIGIGIFVLRAEQPQFITAIAPAIEVHSAVGMNTSSNFGPGNPNAFANLVDLGFIGNMEFLGRARLSVGAVFPVTAPRAFDAELIAQFRVVY